MKLHKQNDKLWKSMQSDCSKCSALCCIALFFSKSDGFPKDKMAGEPCINLGKDYGCSIHSQLEQKKMKGCIGYDCFGAGQHVIQVIYKGRSWNDLPERSAEIADVFTILFQIHQIRYFLTEASLLTSTGPLIKDIEKLIEENIIISHGSPQDILSIDVENYRNKVNVALKQVCKLLLKKSHSKDVSCPKEFFGKKFRGKDMSGLDLSTKLLIAADFSDCTFDGTIFLGADTRDADFSNADLREAVFLTQGQINSAKGNRNARIPAHLYYPVTWK